MGLTVNWQLAKKIVVNWSLGTPISTLWKRFEINTELKQPRRRRQQKPHKFAYLTMKNRIFARFARAFFIFWHFEDVLVLSTTWNDLFCSCVDDMSIWWQTFNFVFLYTRRWFQFNSRIVRTHFSSIVSLNYWKMSRNAKSHFQMTFSLSSTSCYIIELLLSDKNYFITGVLFSFSKLSAVLGNV